MRRHVYDCRLSKGFALLALLSSASFGCDHAQSVLALRDKALASAVSPSSSSSGGADGSSSAGPVDLNATETALAANDSYTGPVVDETDRESCGDTASSDYYVPDSQVQAKAKSILTGMSMDQKVIQLTGIESPNYSDSNRFQDIQRSRDDTDLNVRGIQWRDGPHGLNLEAGRGRQSLQDYSVAFPTSVAQGAAFDTALLEKVGAAMGDETIASGNTLLLGPCMNILRHPYWGRAQETFGEDSFHLGRTATAFTRGLQSYVPGCAKHFAANNIENKRFSNNAAMDEQTLREVYGRHFEMVVRDGGVACVMAAYNAVQGTKSTQNQHLLTEMLRDDMAFKGFVVSDWWAMPGQNNGQGPVDPPQDAINAAGALKAGLDVEVPWALNYDAIPSIVADGTIDSKLVDQAVERVLETKLRFNIADLGSSTIGLKTPTSVYDSSVGSMTHVEGFVALAEQLAEEAMVLVKNDNKALPISSAKTIGVVGNTVSYTVKSDKVPTKDFDFIRNAALGDRGSSRVLPDPSLTVVPLDGITVAASEHGIDVVSTPIYATKDQTDPDLTALANADVNVVVVGLTAGDQGEEYTGASDRSTIALPDIHNKLINSVVALGKPTIVVIESGSVVLMPWIDKVSAVVMAWYPGQAGGTALGRLLLGDANFAGRLPVTWPASDDQLPVFNEAAGGTTTMDYYLGYRRFDHEQLTPLFAFGHGLSYSTFRYERLHIPCSDVTSNGVIHVEVDVRNVSGPAGDEVAFVFASYPETTARRSVKELKGFARFHLEAGEGKRISIPVRVQDLKYWDTNSASWVVEKGPVQIQVGPSSDNLPLKQTFTVK